MAVKKFPVNEDLALLTQELETQSTNVKTVGTENVVLFFSFDIVNATDYKAKHKDKWVDVLSEILRHIISSFSNTSSGGYRFWKTLGDEIIYTKEIYKMDDVIDTLQNVYGTLRMLNQQIAEGMLCDAESGKVLGIKSAAWIAHIADSGASGYNLFTEYLINDNRKQTEYIGPDIDIGFRVAGHSIHNHMVISLPLAHLMMKYDTSEKRRVHLYGYKQLKGVWGGRPYPIIMFNGNPDADLVAELAQLKIASKEKKAEYLKNLTEWQDYEIYSEKRILAELIEDIYLAKKLEHIEETIQRKYTLPNHKLKPFAKVFYAALCYQVVEDKQVFFLAKMKEESKWRFGGTVMYHNFAYLATIKEHYQETFGLELDFINNQDYQTVTPLVLSSRPTKQVDSESIKSTVFLAEIKNPLESLQQPDDWDVRFLTLEEIGKLEEPVVDEFDFILSAAVQFLGENEI